MGTGGDVWERESVYGFGIVCMCMCIPHCFVGQIASCSKAILQASASDNHLPCPSRL